MTVKDVMNAMHDQLTIGFLRVPTNWHLNRVLAATNMSYKGMIEAVSEIQPVEPKPLPEDLCQKLWGVPAHTSHTLF